MRIGRMGQGIRIKTQRSTFGRPKGQTRHAPGMKYAIPDVLSLPPERAQSACQCHACPPVRPDGPAGAVMKPDPAYRQDGLAMRAVFFPIALRAQFWSTGHQGTLRIATH